MTEKKITSLTPEQEAQIPIYRDKWLAIGLSTEPTNFEETKKAAILAYEAAGLKPPENWHITDSPISCAKLQCELKGQKPTKENMQTAFGEQRYGCHDANWLGFYEYFKEVLDIEEVNKLNGLFGIAKHCGWYAAYDDTFIMQHRPTEVHLENGQLHREGGPAILYRDGFSVWALRGMRLNEQIVMKPETQTLDQIEQEENEEIKRVRIERFDGPEDSTKGWLKYLRLANAKVVDTRHNDVENTEEMLVEANGKKVLVPTCKTGRIFAIEVAPEITTCEEAQNYLWSNKGVGLPKSNVLGRS